MDANVSLSEPERRKSRKTSQTRRRKNRRTGHYTDAENRLFVVAYTRYRDSAAAAEYGASESAFIRWSTIGRGAKKLPRRHDLPPDLMARLGSLMTELARQGNNLNQMARRLNEGADISPNSIHEVFSENSHTLRALRQLAGFER